MLTNLRQHGSIDSFSRVTVAECTGDNHQLTFTYSPNKGGSMSQSNNLLSISVAHYHKPPPCTVPTSPPTKHRQDRTSGQENLVKVFQINTMLLLSTRLWLRSALTHCGTDREGAPSPAGSGPDQNTFLLPGH